MFSKNPISKSKKLISNHKELFIILKFNIDKSIRLQKEPYLSINGLKILRKGYIFNINQGN